MIFKINTGLYDYVIDIEDTPKNRRSLIDHFFYERWYTKQSIDDFIRGYIDEVNFERVVSKNAHPLPSKYGYIKRKKSNLEFEKENILENLNKTKKEFIEEVRSSRVEKIRFLLNYMFSDDCSVFRFERLVKSFSIAKGTINSQPTYTLVFDGEVLGEIKGKKRDVERLFKSVTSTLNLGVQCEKTISEDGKTYFFSTDRDAESKLKTGDYLTDEEIRSLCWKHEIVLNKIKDEVCTSVIEIDGDLYAVDWNEDENCFLGQPYKCEIETNVKAIN